MEILSALIAAIKNGAWQIVFPLAVLGLLVIYDKKQNKQIATLEETNKIREKALMDLIENNSKESKDREDRLMEHLEKTNDSHAKIASAMERLELRMEFMEKKIDKEGV
ncbi:hypothetical protein [Clostridium sp. BNL1100]|uniref:hypothetical protein n=1 Tax=Clostridium sp. BNL1100 TaxID=755731 RepID=UPI00024A7A8C|nr:hypothetical protein [Clostridium sp. BNL1100]AEY66596.1 hypothetical protein Clo1100_2425 [Clostridium sp. BNL1100]